MKPFILASLALVVALVAAAPGDPPPDKSFNRERRPGNAAAKDALEGAPPPPLAVTGWLNLPEGVEAWDWSHLKGKVVVIDFWGTW